MKLAVFVALAAFAIAFGVEEAIIVIYLRHLPSFESQTYALEMIREACTLVAIAAVAYLSATAAGLRARAFCFAFGVWDIVYYIALDRLSGFPKLTDDDVLFLIPVPWLAPVWSAVAFAFALVLIGFYGTVKGRRTLLAAGFTLGVLSFMYRTLFNAHQYPVWLFLIAFALVLSALPLANALGSFVRVESARGRQA